MRIKKNWTNFLDTKTLSIYWVIKKIKKRFIVSRIDNIFGFGKNNYREYNKIIG